MNKDKAAGQECSGDRWNPPPDLPALHGDEVHVWRIPLDLPVVAVEHVGLALDASERARAERLRFPRDRWRFVVARGALRAILGHYLAEEPAAMRFRYGPRGKPALDGAGDGNWRFNLSHSGDLALLAVSRGRELGIDVEQVRPELAGESIARRFFSPNEVSALLGLSDGERHEAFFRCWTRKEAYIKARGDGFALRLDAFDVTLAPGEPAALLRTGQEPGDAARWALRDVRIDPGYVAALCVEGRGWRPCLWQWAPQEPRAVP